MANCYVVTALAALAGSRILYALTNPDEFKSVAGTCSRCATAASSPTAGSSAASLGSWAFLAPKKIRLLAWADDAVPSLASGLHDHAHRLLPLRLRLRQAPAGRRAALAEDARHVPPLGRRARSRAATAARRSCATSTSTAGTPLESGAREDELELPRAPDADLRVARRPRAPRASPLAAQVHALPRAGVLPLRVRLRLRAVPPRALARRRRARQLRPDARRARLHPDVPAPHGASGFVFGISLGIANKRARTVARVLAFVPPVVAYLALRPASFAQTRALPALDEPDHRPAQRARRLVLLRALLGVGAQEPDAWR